LNVGKVVSWTIVLLLSMCVGMGILLVGCGNTKEENEKIQDLEYTVVADKEIPEELRVKLEERKSEPFKVTFADSGYIYICVGYGEQERGGHSIGVKELYLTDNAIYVDTILTGPDSEESKGSGKSYPYIVIKTEYRDESVVFE